MKIETTKLSSEKSKNQFILIKSNQMENVFEKLSSINVNDKVEKKNGLTYLSWAWAWGEVKKLYPDAVYDIIHDPVSQKPYFYDENLGYMVMTTVTIQNQTLCMWLPVMDGANKAMMTSTYTYQTRYGEKTVEAATMFDINKTIMRCLTKNLAMHGIGHYIYAGEDLPETENNTPAPVAATPKQEKATTELKDLKKGTDDWDKITDYISKNKNLGLEKIESQISRRYKMTPAIKKEISKLITE